MVRTSHVLSVYVVLANRMPVVLPTVQRHAGDRTRRRTKPVEELLVAPPVTDSMRAAVSELREER